MNLNLSENAQGADNQQERLQSISTELGHYLAGFADGEGSFNISVIRRKSDYQRGWKIAASFNVSQRSSQIPELFQQALGCGTIRFRRDGVCYFEIRNIVDLNTTVRHFFERFPLLSDRQSGRFHLLMEAVAIMTRREHRTEAGLKALLQIREMMISNRPRKYQITDVLAKSSETIRQAHASEMI